MNDVAKMPSPVVAEIDFDKVGKQFGQLRVPQSRNDSGWGTILVPIVCVKNGKGPTILFTAGNHGDEYEGQVTLLKLAKALDPKQVQGRVILLPAMHYPAAVNGTRMSPLDGKDFNRTFPGNPRGTFAEVLAHFIDSRLLPLCDYQMDLHSGGHGADVYPCAVGHHLDDPKMMKATVAMANAFNAPLSLILKEVNAGPTLLAAAEARKIVALSSELGGYARLNRDNLAITERGVRNVMKHCGIMAGKPELGAYGKSRVMTVPGFDCYVFAPKDGIFEPAHDLGATVKAGEVAGWLHLIEDPAAPPLTLKYESAGFLWCVRGEARLRAGDPACVIGRDA